MNNHPFSFAGGEILTMMGATWFVSYSYYEKIDKTHTNWQLVKTANMSKSKYLNSRNYHKFWLEQVLSMDEDRLNTNTLQIDAYETKRMASELLAIM